MAFIKKAALIGFALGFIFGLSFFLEQQFHLKLIPLDSNFQLKLFLGFGCLAFILNLISYRQDSSATHNGNLLYWIGGPMVLLGLILKFSYPYSLYWIVLLLGLLLIFISMVLNFSIDKKESDLIDSDE